MANVAFKPKQDRVLVKPDQAEEKTVSGIIIADTAKEKPQRGTVIAVGPGKTSINGHFIATTTTEGEVVYYGKYSGTEIKIDGVEYMLMKEDDLFGNPL